MNRNNVLDVVKGFAIINIILIHTVWWSGLEYIPYDIIRQLTLMIDVPLFFFLSGWAASLHEQKFKDSIKRILKLYIPYLIMLLVLWSFLFIFYKRLVSFDNILQWITFSKRDSFEIGAVMGSTWFLPAFLITSFTGIFIDKYIRKKRIGIILMFSLLLINIIFSLLNFEIIDGSILGITSLRIIFFYMFFYLLGMCLRDIKITKKQFISLLFSLLVVFLLFLAGSGFILELQLNKFPPTTFYFVASMFSVIITLYLKNFETKMGELIEKKRFFAFLNFSGINVYNLFLYQGFGAAIIYYIVYSQNLRDLHWTIMLPICFFCNLGISYLLAFVFGKINNKILELSFKKS